MRIGWRILLGMALTAALVVAAPGCGGGGGDGGGGGSSATVQGTVHDDGTLQPINGATVAVGSETTTTSANGSFSLETTSGTRTISVSASGYEELELTETLAPGTNSLGAIYVEPELKEGKGAVTGMVTSSGAAAPGATLVSGNAHATAKPDGSYALYNMEAGERGITAVSADGTTTGWATVDVEDGETTTGVNIALTLSPPPPPVLQ